MATLLFVSVVLLLILIIVIKDYRQRYKKTTAVFSANMMNSDAVSNREGCHGDGFYEVMTAFTRHSHAAAVSSAHSLNTETGINREGCHGDSLYEDMKKFTQKSETAGVITDTYAITKLPSNPSDPLLYCSIELVTSSTANHLICSSQAPPISVTVNKHCDT
ncbi:hypothetical protein UPYG_G00059440 [Umbra pygmaea]|uniref:Uncharacterized protein n=1 Tax=Umbra pygmaea TaxID=75934 RepID=A0ABD0X8Z9_UMBPY